MCDTNRPTEYYRLTVSSILGERMRPSRRYTTQSEPKWSTDRKDPAITAASVRYNVNMGNVDLLHEGGEWGVLVESFQTSSFVKLDNVDGLYTQTQAMFIDIPELSVGGSYRLEASDNTTSKKHLPMTTGESTLNLGTCVNSSSVGPAVHLRESSGFGTDLPPVMQMERAQEYPTRCKCGPMGLQSMTVNLVDERGNAFDAVWLRDDSPNNAPQPDNAHPLNTPTDAAKPQMGADYTMTLLFMKM